MIYYKPHRKDALGDGWASKTLRVWDRMRQLDPDLCSVPGAYELWQWAQCESAGVRSHVVASPQACAIAGVPVPVERFDDLIRLSDQVFEELHGAIP